MRTSLIIAAALAALLPVSVHADTMQKPPAHSHMVLMYKAAKCGMIFTPAQAVKYHYACPISHGKMSKVMLSPSAATMGEQKTMTALGSMKHSMSHM